MTYKIEFRPGVVRQIKKLPKEVKDWFLDVTEKLASAPTPKNSRTVTNSPYMRIKPDRHIDDLETKQYKAVQNYRIVYLLHEESVEILVISIAHRKEVYKKLSKL